MIALCHLAGSQGHYRRDWEFVGEKVYAGGDMLYCGTDIFEMTSLLRPTALVSDDYL